MQPNSIDFLSMFKDMEGHIAQLSADFVKYAMLHIKECVGDEGALFDVKMAGGDIITLSMSQRTIDVIVCDCSIRNWLLEQGVQDNTISDFEKTFIDTISYINLHPNNSEGSETQPVDIYSSFYVRKQSKLAAAGTWWISIIELEGKELNGDLIETVIPPIIKGIVYSSLIIYLLRKHKLTIGEFYHLITPQQQATVPRYS